MHIDVLNRRWQISNFNKLFQKITQTERYSSMFFGAAADLVTIGDGGE